MEDVYLTSPCLQIPERTFKDYTTGLVLSCTHLCDMNQPDKTPDCLERCPEFRQCLLSTTTNFEPSSDNNSPISDQAPSRGLLIAIFILSSAVIVVACSVFTLWICSRRRRNPSHDKLDEMKDTKYHVDIDRSSPTFLTNHSRYGGRDGEDEECFPLNISGLKPDEKADSQSHQNVVQSNVNHMINPGENVLHRNLGAEESGACHQSAEHDRRQRNTPSTYRLEQNGRHDFNEQESNVRISNLINESHAFSIEFPDEGYNDSK